MQTFKDRNKQTTAAHQRSLSFCHYDEFRNRAETEFRQRRPLLDSDDQQQTAAAAAAASKMIAVTAASGSTFVVDEPHHHQQQPAIPANDLLLNGHPDDDIESFDNDNRRNRSDTNDSAELTRSLLAPCDEERAIAKTRTTTTGTATATASTSGTPAAAAPCSSNSSSFSSHASSTDLVKGHRRSLSLRQRFEVGVEYIVSEFEYARTVAEKTVIVASETVWKVCHFSHLPNWMQDNEYLHWGHRPPLPSLWACAKSVFRLHTETGNIWTHVIGALIFVALLVYEFATISAHKTANDRLMLAIYFCGIILCLLFSAMFHTFSCYASPRVIKIFSKLDYCGISLQIIGSMIPALYYGFYNNMSTFTIYLAFGVVLCVLSIIVSMWDKFGEPRYRSLRAIVFLTFGLSNVIPGIHWYIVLDPRLWFAFGLFILQGALYVVGALLYANRIPERLLPGKCDYVFQSHQIFHVLVVLAALVHLNGINEMADFRTRMDLSNAAAAAAAAASAAASASAATPMPPLIST